jgi:mRNA-degrading endonuclease RelE of RelBE toxin-antitoxin system
VKLYFHPEADREFSQLDEARQRAVNRKVAEFRKEGLSHSLLGRLKNEEVGLDCYRLKVMENKAVEVNLRIVIDVYEGQFVAFGVKNRDEVYTEEYIKEIRERKY